MEILNIYLEEQLLIKWYVTKHLILLEIQNMSDIKGVFLGWFINYLMKRLQVVLLKGKIVPNKELVEELYKPVIRKFEKRKAIFIVLI